MPLSSWRSSILGPFSSFLGLFSQDLGIDLGTANMLVYARDKGVIVSEPSVVAMDMRTKKVLAVGAEAKRMVGRTPRASSRCGPSRTESLRTSRPSRPCSVISSIMCTPAFNWCRRPRVIVGIPSGVTEVEKRAVQDAAINAGAREAYLIEEPMAAAIGAGLPVDEPAGNMIVDIGGGTTEVAVVSLGGIVVSRSVRVAGDEVDQTIIDYARQAYDLLVGERTAEETKMAIGSAFPLPDEQEKTFEMRGRDMLSGLPKTVTITQAELREAIAGPVSDIIEAVKVSVEETPPELLGDVVDRGIVLTGGGALLGGIDARISEETLVPVVVAENALTCVALGTGECLNDIESYQKLFVSDTREYTPVTT